MPVLLEGYGPPHHPDIKRMASRPKCHRVNVPPVDSWSEQVEQFTTLYDAGHQLHLTADTDVDGTYTGTGGGCHVVVGGASPHDSPWLRRPAVLGRLITYWLNHPSLTCIFRRLCQPHQSSTTP